MKEKTRYRYRHFNEFCLRTPLFPLSYYVSLTHSKLISFEKLKKLWENKILQEAVYLASPSLFYEIEKSFIDSDEKEIKDIHLALLKYMSRMATRCTPFGLFAGCTMGSIAETTNISVTEPQFFNRQTRFDMNFLVLLSQKLTQDEKLKQNLLFYPNSSLYQTGNQLRFIEYTYQDKQRVHSIEAVIKTPYLQTLLKEALTGKKLKELATSILSDTVHFDEALDFVNELVANQILVSELDPTLTGTDYLQVLLKRTKSRKDFPKLADFLTKLDSKIGHSPTIYQTINKKLHSLEIDIDKKYLFQTDLFISTHSNQLAKETFIKIKEGLVFLSKITPKEENTALSNFKKGFFKRYEAMEVPLVEALDVEMGIGYLQNQNQGDTPILEDLFFDKTPKTQEKNVLTLFQKKLYQKLHSNMAKPSYTLEITEKEIREFQENWDDLPTTMSALVEIYKLNSSEILFMNAVGGSSAANLLGRFGMGDTSIQQHTQNIIDLETKLHKDQILAEIVHLPEARTGNILRRPSFREYEIPYLGKSSLPLAQQIPIQDLMLSVQGDSLYLRSKKHDKEVIPRLSNAHNFKRNALPIYHFLADLQTQNLRSSLYFSWGNLASNYPFLPRLTYKSIVFSKARWLLRKEDIKTLQTDLQHSKQMQQVIKKWRFSFYKPFPIPQYVQLVDGDNTLLINLENETSTKMLLQTVKKRDFFILQEFLFDEDGIVKSKRGGYTNQFVFSFYKPNKLIN